MDQTLKNMKTEIDIIHDNTLERMSTSGNNHKSHKDIVEESIKDLCNVENKTMYQIKSKEMDTNLPKGISYLE